jgi:hypothetical protein
VVPVWCTDKLDFRNNDPTVAASAFGSFNSLSTKAISFGTYVSAPFQLLVGWSIILSSTFPFGSYQPSPD